MKKHINKIEGYPDLRKDSNSNGVLNANMDSLEAYKKRRNQIRQIEKVTTEMNELKSDMADIKKSLEIIIKGMQ